MTLPDLLQRLPALREIFPKEKIKYQERESKKNEPDPEHAFYRIEWWSYQFVYDEEEMQLSDEPVLIGRMYGHSPAVDRAISNLDDELTIVHFYRVA